MIQNAVLFQDAALMTLPQPGRGAAAAAQPAEIGGVFNQMLQVRLPAGEQTPSKGNALPVQEPSAAQQEGGLPAAGEDLAEAPSPVPAGPKFEAQQPVAGRPGGEVIGTPGRKAQLVAFASLRGAVQKPAREELITSETFSGLETAKVQAAPTKAPVEPGSNDLTPVASPRQDQEVWGNATPSVVVASLGGAALQAVPRAEAFAVPAQAVPGQEVQELPRQVVAPQEVATQAVPTLAAPSQAVTAQPVQQTARPSQPDVVAVADATTAGNLVPVTGHSPEVKPEASPAPRQPVAQPVPVTGEAAAAKANPTVIASPVSVGERAERIVSAAAVRQVAHAVEEVVSGANQAADAQGLVQHEVTLGRSLAEEGASLPQGARPVQKPATQEVSQPVRPTQPAASATTAEASGQPDAPDALPTPAAMASGAASPVEAQRGFVPTQPTAGPSRHFVTAPPAQVAPAANNVQRDGLLVAQSNPQLETSVAKPETSTSAARAEISTEAAPGVRLAPSATATVQPEVKIAAEASTFSTASVGRVETEPFTPQEQLVTPSPGEGLGTKIAVAPTALHDTELPGKKEGVTRPQAEGRAVAATQETVEQWASQAVPEEVLQEEPAQQTAAKGGAIRETGGAAQQQRAARLVKELYGAGFVPKSVLSQGESQQGAAAVTAESEAAAGQISVTSNPQVSKIPTLSQGEQAVTQNQGVPFKSDSSTDAALPEQQPTGGSLPGGVKTAAGPNPALGTTPQAAPVAAPSSVAAVQQGMQEIPSDKEEPILPEMQRPLRQGALVTDRGEQRREEPAAEKTADATPQQSAAAKVAGAPETAKGGAFGDHGRKEQHEQKPQEKETAQVQPLGVGVQPTHVAQAAAPEVKPANLKSALHESILSQVRDGMVTQDHKGNSQISIRLNPGELGELKIQVRMEDNRLRVEVQADNKVVKDLLLSNLDSLKETLASKNFTMEGFDVSTGSREGFNNPLSDDKGSSWQRPYAKSAKSGSYAAPEGPARVNYLTGGVNNLLDVRF